MHPTSAFEGKDLEDRSIKFYLTHEPCCNNAFFEGDVVETALSLDLKTDTFAFFVNYGMTDSLDVGVAVPILHVSMDTSVEATIQRSGRRTGPRSTSSTEAPAPRHRRKRIGDGDRRHHDQGEISLPQVGWRRPGD